MHGYLQAVELEQEGLPVHVPHQFVDAVLQGGGLGEDTDAKTHKHQTHTHTQRERERERETRVEKAGRGMPPTLQTNWPHSAADC